MAAATPVLHPALWDAVSMRRNDDVKKLIADGADIEERGGPGKTTPLFAALYHSSLYGGGEDVVQLLLEANADVSATTADGWAPLHYAADRGLEAMARRADVTAKHNSIRGGYMPVHFAALCGREALVRLLLEYGTGPSAKTDDGTTPLHVSTFHGHETVVRLLLDKSADVSAKANNGATPLHAAAFGGHVAVARLLLTAGADVWAKHKGMTPEEAATACSHLEVVAMIKAEAVRKVEAFAMGQHERLGAGSWVRELEPGVVRMVLEQV